MSSGCDKEKKHAFTLIELTLVAALIAVIGLVVYASFSAGAKIWERAKNNIPEADAHIFLGKISSDLRNAFKFSGIKPSGGATDISFASYSASSGSTGFGEVSYSFGAQKEKIVRKYLEYPRFARNDMPDNSKIVLDNVKSLLFKYYYFNPELKEGVWKDAIEENLPSAVKIEISVVFKDQKTATLSKIITVYAGI